MPRGRVVAAREPLEDPAPVALRVRRHAVIFAERHARPLPPLWLLFVLRLLAVGRIEEDWQLRKYVLKLGMCLAVVHHVHIRRLLLVGIVVEILERVGPVRVQDVPAAFGVRQLSRPSQSPFLVAADAIAEFLVERRLEVAHKVDYAATIDEEYAAQLGGRRDLPHVHA